MKRKKSKGGTEIVGMCRTCVYIGKGTGTGGIALTIRAPRPYTVIHCLFSKVSFVISDLLPAPLENPESC